MILDTGSNRSLQKEAFTGPHLEIQQTRDYLQKRWQEAFDQLSDVLIDAVILYFELTPRGYQLVLGSRNHQEYYGLNNVYEAQGSDFIDLIRAYGRMLIVEAGHEDERIRHSREVGQGFRNLIGMPIVNHKQNMVGIFMVMRPMEPSITNGDIKLITWLAESVEESIKVLGYEEENRKMKQQDPLTKLVSRERMMGILQQEFERSQRSDMPFSMVLIDIDDFRHINEEYGHSVGDDVLQRFAELIMERIRYVDTASRWDGDTFAILLPQTELIGANQLVDELFGSLTHHIFPRVGRCYFSMGVADYSPNDRKLGDMLKRLDQALYRVKAFGGNAHMTKYH